MQIQLEEEKHLRKYSQICKAEEDGHSKNEEEFDLTKLDAGEEDKNRSEDINIDYPDVQRIKDKYTGL